MIVLTLSAAVAVICLALVACYRSGWRFRVVLVESFRVFLVAVALILLSQPETTRTVTTDRPDQVVLLVDRSASMNTEDVANAASMMSRNAVSESIVNHSAWQRLDDRLERIEVVFAEDVDASSELGEALAGAAERFDSARSIVFVSDGDWNSGRNPVSVAAEMTMRRAGQTRIFAVPIGASERLPDVELESVDAPTFGVVEKPVRIPYAIRNWFAETRRVSASLIQDGHVVERREVQIPSGGRFDGTFTWTSAEEGEYAFAVEVSLDDDETDRDNNRAEKTIEVRRERLRVLVIESVPRWEFRYLRNALRRDPGIEVSCLLFHPGLEGVGGGDKDYLSVLPDEPAELASYDVIFVGDVGVFEDQLTVEQCRQIRGLVQQQAAGLVLMPGPLGRQQSLWQSELEELFPVVVDRSLPRGVGSEEPATFSLTDSGRRSLLTQLIDDGPSNWSVWESLPGFYWHTGVVRSKVGSQVLAVHSTSSNRYGRLPLLVSRTAGAGKVLFMATDSAWRWRLGVEDKYHYRFWGQVIRWMAYQRNMAVGESIRLSYRPEQPVVAESVSLRASVMNAEGTPSDKEFVIAYKIAADGSRQPIRLERADSDWGVFVGSTQFDRPGEYRVTLTNPSDDSTVEARVAVQGRAVEQVGRPARADIMNEISRVGGGQVFSPDQVDQLVEEINQIPPAASMMRRIQWWNHPAVLLGMVGGLGLFWIGRKWAGAI